MTSTLKQIIESGNLPQSVEYDNKNNLFLFKNWYTHELISDGKVIYNGGEININYTTVDEDGYPESSENLKQNIILQEHVYQALLFHLKENFKIKPKILSYITSQLDDYLIGFDVDTNDIKKNLHKHIALQGIDLLSENHDGYSKVSYIFMTSWHYPTSSALEVLVLKDKPEDIAQAGMVWE